MAEVEEYAANAGNPPLFPRVAAQRNHGIGLISTCNWLMSRSGKLPSRFESGL
jgi:hypothetical protein